MRVPLFATRPFFLPRQSLFHSYWLVLLPFAFVLAIVCAPHLTHETQWLGIEALEAPIQLKALSGEAPGALADLSAPAAGVSSAAGLSPESPKAARGSLFPAGLSASSGSGAGHP